MLIQIHGGNDMLNILYDISYDFEIPTLDGDEFSILISSDDNASCRLVYDIIAEIFFKNELVFKASGLLDNITGVLDMIQNCSPVYFEGDGKKFFVKKQPEVYAKISDKKILSSIFDNWVSTIYERRIIYLPREGQINYLFDILEENIYLNSNNILSTWTYLDCMIENSPDAPNHNTFILTFRKDYFNQINDFLGKLI